MSDMKFLTAFFILFSFSFKSFSADFSAPVSSALDGKYQVVSGPLAAKDHFKLNTYSGEVSNFCVGKNKKGEKINTWCGIINISNPKSYSKPTYKLILSGIRRDQNTLLDTTSGKTYLFFIDSETKQDFLMKTD